MNPDDIRLINLLRAKSEREREEGKNVKLKDHIIETLKRAKQLRDFVKANSETITFSAFKDDKFFSALAIALILHDLGKISYDFQKKVHNKDSKDWKDLKEFLKPIRGVNVRHEILSSIWASILLDSNDEWKDWVSKIRTAVLLHHYNEYYIGEKDLMEIIQNYFEDMRTYLKFVTNNWQKLNEFLNDLLDSIRNDFAGEIFIISAVNLIRSSNSLERAKTILEMVENRGDDISEFAEFYEIDNENPDYDFLVFLGCLRRCDYSASGEVELEGRDGKIIKLEEIYENINNRIKEKIKKEPDWQEIILEKIEPLKSVVLIAPTGSGKTEFALLWNAKNIRKLVYTLPLRVALNDLFWRFKEGYFNDEVDILHSTAFIEYLEEEQKGKALNVEKQLTASKLLSTPVSLTTPDQVFLTSLNYYGSDKVIAVYPLSSIVIDEIQAYDPDMAAIIIKTLQIVQKLGGVVLVTTATLPPYFEPFLEELKFEKVDTLEIKEKVKNYNIKRHKIEVVDDYLANYMKIDNRYLIEINELNLNKYIKKYKEKNIFIILNNVSKAIKVYEKLKNKYPNVFLLHSRLIEKEKDRRIKEIKKKLSKNERSIVVATQMIEASVDLDFDVMITEVSPIDSQIQRWGRIYRNRDSDYDDEQPNIVVFVGKTKNGGMGIDRGTKAIYDKRVVEKTIEVLKEYDGELLSYDDERKMIEEVFDREIEVDDPELLKTIRRDRVCLKNIYVEEIKRNLEFLKYFTVGKRSQAQRLFRRVVGVQVVIPAIMEIDGDEIDKAFAKIVKNPEGNRMSWKEIENEVGLNKWKLKKRLYQYSTNIPIFYWEVFAQLIKHEFKGFYVTEISKEEAKKTLEYGIDILRTLPKNEEDYLEEIFL